MWPMRQKMLHFHVIHVKVSNGSQCSRTLLINVEIDIAYCFGRSGHNGLLSSLVVCVCEREREFVEHEDVFDVSFCFDIPFLHSSVLLEANFMSHLVLVAKHYQ